MAIRINGKDMKDAILRTDQFEMRVLEFVPERMRMEVKGISGQPFNFVPRFLEIVYPEKSIGVKDSGIMTVGAGKAVELTVQFLEKLRIEAFLMMDLRYAKRRLGVISVE